MTVTTTANINNLVFLYPKSNLINLTIANKNTKNKSLTTKKQVTKRYPHKHYNKHKYGRVNEQAQLAFDDPEVKFFNVKKTVSHIFMLI